jgi:hypothetical protein
LQLYQLGGAFLLAHMRLCDAWAMAVFAERARQNPNVPLDILMCKRLVLELGQELKPSKRALLLPMLPEGLRAEIAANTKLFPKPKVQTSSVVLVHKPKPTKSFWRTLLGA